jgi:hypothetical protein
MCRDTENDESRPIPNDRATNTRKESVHAFGTTAPGTRIPTVQGDGISEAVTISAERHQAPSIEGDESRETKMGHDGENARRVRRKNLGHSKDSHAP